MLPQEKTCTKCGKNKPTNKFETGRNKCLACRGEEAKVRIKKRQERTQEERESLQKVKYPNGQKTCSICKQDKLLCEFIACSTNLDGLDPECKECHAKKYNKMTEILQNRTDLELANDIIHHYGDVFTATKLCSKCGTVKSLDDFYIDRSTLNGVMPICIECSKEKQIEKVNEIKEFQYLIKTQHSCAKCGLKDPRCLDFAHYRREDKARTCSGNPIQPCQLSIKRFTEELDKGRFLCHNCHRDETINEAHRNPNYKPFNSLGKSAVNKEKLLRGRCLDCGLVVTEDNYYRFDFDHRVPEDKVMKISRMVILRVDVAIIIREMDKCDLRCGNCHMIKTLEKSESGSKPRESHTSVISVLENYFLVR